MALRKSSESLKDRIGRICAVLTTVLMTVLLSTMTMPANAGRVSRFGQYEGYSKAVYDSWVRTSQYIEMRDGIKLAVDIIRPAINGEVEVDPLPAVWSHTRYRRAVRVGDEYRTAADNPFLKTLLEHGYVVAVVDVRGSGASFGSWQGLFTPEETQDAYEVTEWLASQSWCDGNVGMTGGSYLGITQLMAASTHPPHLKAIFPIVAFFDLYDLCYPGGIFHDDLTSTWSDLTRRMDIEAVAAPVDEDTDELMLRRAVRDHMASRSLLAILSPLPFRDDRDPVTEDFPYREWHPAGVIEQIKSSGVPVYLSCGWYDAFTRDGFLMYRNLTVPKKILIGSWSHSTRDRTVAEEQIRLLNSEHLRWFDHWLKGINNGIMDGPLIHYQTMISPKQTVWNACTDWPRANAYEKVFYFRRGPTGSVSSVNDGLLLPDPPVEHSGGDEYKVDYTATSGTTTRWDNTVGGGFGYPDMTVNDQKCLTYTTSPLDDDVEVTGHPVVALWIRSTADDGDFFAYLEEVDAEGVSQYITEGCLRASHRELHEPPYDNLGLPYHRSYREDVKPLIPEEPAELRFDMHPTSNVFEAGHRIRITVSCIDKDNAYTPRFSPRPTVTLLRTRDHASSIVLPILPHKPEANSPFLVAAILAGAALLMLLLVISVRKFRKKKEQRI